MTLPHKSFVRWSPAWSRGMFKNHPCPQGKDAFLSGNSSGNPMLNSIPACYSSVTEAAEKKNGPQILPPRWPLSMLSFCPGDHQLRLGRAPPRGARFCWVPTQNAKCEIKAMWLWVRKWTYWTCRRSFLWFSLSLVENLRYRLAYRRLHIAYPSHRLDISRNVPQSDHLPSEWFK